MTRMLVYGAGASAYSQDVQWGLVVAASMSTFLGAFVGARVLKKVTIRAVQISVSSLLILVSIGLITGFV